jgi:hypothetical protein
MNTYVLMKSFKILVIWITTKKRASMCQLTPNAVCIVAVSGAPIVRSVILNDIVLNTKCQ